MSLRTNLRFESKSAVSWLTALWIFLMTAVFPYYMKNHYSQMGVWKFSFFLTVSLVCPIPAGVLAAGSWGKAFAAKVFWRMHKPESDAKTQTGGQAQKGVQTQAHSAARSLSNLDVAMLCYLAAIFVSCLFSVDRAAAWTGTDGWSMGLRTQALLVLMYFLVS